jgi:hypothetical protein
MTNSTNSNLNIPVAELLSTIFEHQKTSNEAMIQNLVENMAKLFVQSEDQREAPLPRTNIPDFYGNPSDDVNSWLFIIEQYFRATNTSSR